MPATGDAQMLRDSLARLEAIVATAVDGIVTIDQHGVIDMVNGAVERLFGYASSELIGRNISVLMPEQTARDHDGYLRTYRETGQRHGRICGREVVGKHKDGTPVHLELSVAEMRIGGLRMFTGILRDINERKRHEQVMRENSAALTRSNAELEQFAYAASHDLQEPLRKVASYVQVLAEDYASQLDDQAREYIDFAVDGASRMRSLIDDLLAVSRVNVGTMTLRVCDCNQIVREVLNNFALTLDEIHATVTVGDLPRVTADRAHLRQVFHNLLSNAVKYRRKDVPLTIDISVRHDDGYWEFSMQDNGVGFKEEYSEKIFMMFRRLVSRDDYPGTGMGLALVEKVVTNHGGRVSARSRPGVGSTFSFTLPFS